MIGCLGESRATQQSDMVARAVIVVRSHWLVWVAPGWASWQAWLRAAREPRISSALRALPRWSANRVDQDRPLRPVR